MTTSDHDKGQGMRELEMTKETVSPDLTLRVTPHQRELLQDLVLLETTKRTILDTSAKELADLLERLKAAALKYD